MKTRRVGSSQGCVAIAENGVTTFPVVGTEKRNKLTEFGTKLARSVLSSSSSTLVATDVDTKDLGLIESGSENAEKSWLGMVVGFVAINHFLDSVTSVHACPKSSATHTTFVSKFGVCERWCTKRWICTVKCAQHVRCCP